MLLEILGVSDTGVLLLRAVLTGKDCPESDTPLPTERSSVRLELFILLPTILSAARTG
jgi:hypothetical protein